MPCVVSVALSALCGFVWLLPALPFAVPAFHRWEVNKGGFRAVLPALGVLLHCCRFQLFRLWAWFSLVAVFSSSGFGRGCALFGWSLFGRCLPVAVFPFFGFARLPAVCFPLIRLAVLPMLCSFSEFPAFGSFRRSSGVVILF